MFLEDKYTDNEFLNKFKNDLFLLIKKEIANPKLNTIHIQNFGKFYVRKIKIDKMILSHIKHIREGNNVEERKNIIRVLWEARKGKSYIRI